MNDIQLIHGAINYCDVGDACMRQLMNHVIIGSINGLSLVRGQAFTWVNADLMLIGSFAAKTKNIILKEMHLKILSAKTRVGNSVPAWNVSFWLVWRVRCD